MASATANAISNPFYTDWTFWAFIISTIALALSQLPPVRTWFRKAKLEIEIHSKICLSHKLGHPNLQAHIIINNIGSRDIRIKKINAKISRDERFITTLPVQNFRQNETDMQNRLFISFRLRPGEEWSHMAHFFHYLEREDENALLRLQANMNTNLRIKSQNLPYPPPPVEADPIYVQQSLDLFNKHYIWNPGEYKLHFIIETDDPKVNLDKTFRFTLFESHVETLNEIKDQYKLGGGVTWDPANISFVYPDIKAA